MNKYLYWALLWLPLFLIAWVFRLLAPIACLFVVREPRTDVVKRYNKQTLMLLRDDLPDWLSWFRTFDNAADEYWLGCYPLTKHFTEEDYSNYSVLRWFFRVCWLWRNSAYTFNKKFFGIAKDSPMVWQYKADKPLPFGYYNSINIGWKAHKNVGGLMFAGRILGIRKN